MENFVKRGDVITITAPAAVTSGVGVLVGTALFGVAMATYANGASGEIQVEGEVELAKTSALAIAAGDRVYWDNTNKVVNKTAAAQLMVGVATAAAANPSATVKVKLTPGVFFTGAA